MADSRVSSLTAVSGAALLSTDVLYLEHSITLSSAKITVAELTTGIKTQGQFLSSASIAAAYLTSASAATAYQPAGDYVGSASLQTAIAEFVTSNSISSRIATSNAEFVTSNSISSRIATALSPYTTSNSVSAAIAEFVTSASLSVRYVSMATRQLTGGYWANITSDGSISTGTYTPFTARTGSNFRRIVNNGAFTLNPPTLTSSAAVCLSVLVVNAATSAGAITTTAFTDVSGDSFDTTANNEFLCRIDVFHDGSAQYSALNVVALQ